ncbi:MAG: hypothetical protein HKN20_06885 [Gemmatimonadetes bacterium]|nr:hypothetical protein [Gemmatimonadota bacterium]
MSREKPPSVPYRAPRLPGADALRAQFDSILESGIWNRGPIVSRFEREFAARAGVGDAVLCSSATASLTLLLRADAPEGAIVMPALQFPPVFAALRDSGHEAIFADVDPRFWTARSPSLSRAVETAGVSMKFVSGFLGAPSFGETASCPGGEEWGREHAKPVWFDSCHAFGSSLDGRPSGSFGRAEVFSLTPSKLVIAGEGGVVTTDDQALAEELRALRDYGKRADGTFDPRGASARASEWTAGLALASLSLLGDEIDRRNRVIAVYREELAGTVGIEFQASDDRLMANGQECAIRVDAQACGTNRDRLRSALRAGGVESIPTYLKCLPERRAAFPVACALEAELLHLPLGIDVDERVAQRIARSIAEQVAGETPASPPS